MGLNLESVKDRIKKNLPAFFLSDSKALADDKFYKMTFSVLSSCKVRFKPFTICISSPYNKYPKIILRRSKHSSKNFQTYNWNQSKLFHELLPKYFQV